MMNNQMPPSSMHYKTSQTIIEKQREQLYQMLSVAMKYIRWLGWNGYAHQAGDLADAFENLPDLLSVNAIDWERLRRDVERYEQKYDTTELQWQQRP